MFCCVDGGVVGGPLHCCYYYFVVLVVLLLAIAFVGITCCTPKYMLDPTFPPPFIVVPLRC